MGKKLIFSPHVDDVGREEDKVAIIVLSTWELRNALGLYQVANTYLGCVAPLSC